MKLLGREDILEAEDSEFEVVEVPEWGGSVKIKGMTGTERDMFEGSLQGKDPKTKESIVVYKNARAKLASLSIVGDGGERLFTEKDVIALGKKSASALNRVFEVAQRLSGITDKDIEELEGNSGPDQSEDSTST